MILNRRGVITGSGALLAAGAARAQDDPDLTLTGRFVQGGHALGRTWPRALIFIDGESLTAASADGRFIIGFDRDAPGSIQIEARLDGRVARRTLDVAGGRFPSTRINGLPPSTVAPSDPELLARIRREVVLKTEGFASRIDADHFHDGFDWPLEGFRVSSRWGSQRVLNGTPARPHYGIDLAAPQGTVIRAPAAGRITLAQPGLHFEGGLVLIDHGQGLITAYLHQSRIDVAAGQDVRRGEPIGRVGMTGRATGPHLCWRMKWRDRNLDPSLLVKT
ncbi:MAG: M23 family metallopeptidase [Alphaproteobacteria bacterium]|nr:M23 family metallopeptidase [Alphaproteobacteria bacterium]MBU2042123.1 M23 family metallopeptidase [Alphaproteobacteria bacterium]MBU2127275.1 M23 family metallopeptidase [Alphaproteobacteria bacterium]MBU2208802.1 M23 family metallopeptidase [Alphaproteobacteria bacterium]MBU2291994.1 M23 family metallopeptidase [Alphaproteobacteria bacterium]